MGLRLLALIAALLAAGACLSTHAANETVFYCPEIIGDSATGQASYSAAYFNTPVVYGVCPAGWDGVSWRECTDDAEWGPVNDTCTRLQCPVDEFDNATWAAVDRGTYGDGVCNPGFTGSPRRLCNLYTGWTDIIANRCAPLPECPVDEFGDASWPATDRGNMAAGVCHLGFAGDAARLCDLHTGWWQVLESPCTRILCAENGSWAEAPSNTSWVRPCPPMEGLAGFVVIAVGQMARTCLLDGTWGPEEPHTCGYGVNAENTAVLVFGFMCLAALVTLPIFFACHCDERLRRQRQKVRYIVMPKKHRQEYQAVPPGNDEEEGGAGDDNANQFTQQFILVSDDDDGEGGTTRGTGGPDSASGEGDTIEFVDTDSIPMIAMGPRAGGDL